LDESIIKLPILSVFEEILPREISELIFKVPVPRKLTVSLLLKDPEFKVCPELMS
jgi:hypothetical protein